MTKKKLKTIKSSPKTLKELISDDDSKDTNDDEDEDNDDDEEPFLAAPTD